MQENYFGIDFGTTNTAVVAIIAGEHSREVVNCGESNRPFPSLVAIKKDGSMPVLAGYEVRLRRMELASDYHIFSSFKSKLGTPEAITIGGEVFTARKITAIYLHWLKSYIQTAHGLDLTSATFAIPVDFSAEQRRDLRLAAAEAGIKINQFVSEPTAAYIHSRRELADQSKVAVFDWGGGTLDVSVLEVTGDILTELETNGEPLGGDDIDETLAKRLHAKLAAQTAELGRYEDMPPKDKDYMRTRSEATKISLSTEPFERVRFLDYGGRPHSPVPIEQQEFSEMIKPSVDKALVVLYEAIKKAGITRAQLDAVLMVGGSSAIPAIQSAMEVSFGRKEITVIAPDNMQWAVASGAATIDTSQTKYRLSQSVGVILSDESFFPIFEKDAEIPCVVPRLVFGLPDDLETPDAHFVFADENRNVLGRISLPVKGFTVEGLKLDAAIGEDRIADVSIFSDHMPDQVKHVAIRHLNFYYDLSERTPEAPTPEPEVPRKPAGTCVYWNCTAPAMRDGLCKEHFTEEKYRGGK